ncbi:unnamed protein product, partial [Pylaiella littoralis]
GKRGVDTGSSVADLQSVMGDNVLVTERVLETMRSFGSFDVREFVPVSVGSDLPSIPDHFDLAGVAIIHLLHFGLCVESSAEDARVAQRLQPIGMAILHARTSFRQQILKNQDVLGNHAMRGFVAEIPNGDLQRWSTSLTKWLFQFSQMHAAPAAFDLLPPPPVPEFTDVQHFVRSCANLIRIARIQLGPTSEGVGRGGGDGAKRKRLLQSGGDRKRAGVRYCFQFRKTGSCKYG